MDKELMLKQAFGCIDNTTLEGSDTEERVRRLCEDSLRMQDRAHGIPNVAAVCVYPVFVRLAKQTLRDSPIRVASVAGAFPSGQSPLHIKTAEVRYAVDEGADEIDIVIPCGALMEGKSNQVFDEIAAMRQACGNALLKVIIESGELQTSQLIRQASQIAINASADFIKTSTGKTAVSATIDAAKIMMQVIDEHYKKSGKMVGFKAAGGISTPEQAIQYANIAYSVFGKEYFNNQHFRIGASRLVKNLFSFLTNQPV